MPKKLLTFDYGASSGRGILGEYNGDRLVISELHRFQNEPVTLAGHLHWDFLRLFHELKQGLVKAAREGHTKIDSIGVDTWGVDFGLLDENGMLVGNPFHYRDTLTEGEMEAVFEKIPRRELYDRTGLQYLRFNTIYQLHALSRKYPAILGRAKDLLLMPDLFNYFLTGAKTAEFSMVSTTQLYNLSSKDWDFELMSRLGLDAGLLQNIIPSGTSLGPLLADITDETGVRASVTTVCGHDTGSAVLAVPMREGESCAYLSCGTWSLLGVELDAPLTSDAAYDIEYTNEGGFGGTVRFLKNIMGLWIYQEVKREFEKAEGAVDYKTLDAEILSAPAYARFINPDDEAFLTPGHMTEKIRSFCRKTGQSSPETRGETLRCVLESLALTYRESLSRLESVLGRALPVLRVVGGGCKDRIFMDFTAGATGRPILAGPVEATAVGNIAAQLISLREVSDAREARELVSRSFGIDEYYPRNGAEWDEAAERFLKILK